MKEKTPIKGTRQEKRKGSKSKQKTTLKNAKTSQHEAPRGEIN